MAVQKINILKDAGGTPTYAVALSDTYTCALSANTDTVLTVPSGANIAVFGYASANDYWVSTSAITIPSSGSFSLTNFYLNPPPLQVAFGQTLHFISANACVISVTFYST